MQLLETEKKGRGRKGREAGTGRYICEKNGVCVRERETVQSNRERESVVLLFD